LSLSFRFVLQLASYFFLFFIAGWICA